MILLNRNKMTNSVGGSVLSCIKMTTCFAFLFSLACVSAIEADDAESVKLEEQAFKQAVTLAEDSVVRIQTIGGLDKIGRNLISTGPTTGVVVSKDGYILTSSFNFVGKPASIIVTFKDGRKFPAKQIATDAVKKITLIKIDAKKLSILPIAKKSDVEVGQWAIAVGRTYDPEVPNISIGIVSAKNRIWGKAIQVDAKISPTNYGGPLLDVSGKFVGILVPLSTRGTQVSAGTEWYDSGIGFAIPAEEALARIDQMKKGKNLVPGLLGVSFVQTSKLGYDPPKIKQVRVGSPAEKAGIKKGDLLVSILGIKTPTYNSVKHVMGNQYAGEEIAVTYKRGDKTFTQKAKLVETLVPYEAGFLGILPERPLSDESADTGIKIRHVFSGSAAEKSGLEKGDVITKLNDTDLTGSSDLSRKVRVLKPKQSVKITYSREGKSQTVDLKLTSFSSAVPEKLSTVAIPPGEEKVVPGVKSKVGNINFKLPEFKASCWAIVPDFYNPKASYPLVVWLHPSNSRMEKTIKKQWKSICNQRGIILLAPEARDIAGWSTGDLEIIAEGIKHMKKEYNIDSNRVVLFGYENGATFAFQAYFRHRDLFQGILAISGLPRVSVLENSPDFPVQISLIAGAEDKISRVMKRAAKKLRAMKYPTGFIPIKKWGADYPDEHDDLFKKIGRWVDSLDRI